MGWPEHFDTDAFDMLKEVMDDEFPDLLRVYIEDSDSRLPLLHQALAAADASALRELAHSFKGASSNISALPLADLCFSLESAAKNGELSGLDQVISAIEQEYSTVKNYLQPLLA
ncbi:Hpt domain-containing protein [Bacterioplanoides sp.]|uniref:Hpt domain-containing protein n=1 Tax=Bacterioplanoides sp. TaxID=2066072 RepID=UPI003B5C7BA9